MLPPTDPLVPAIDQAIDQLPLSMQPLLKSWLAQHSLARLTPEMMQQLMHVSGLDCRGVTLALLPIAAAYSYAAISHFHVGAIVWGTSGNFYLGANMEFAKQSLSQTIHAEQCAINHAWLSGETGLLGITINASPCGHCRQFMNETISAPGLTIHLPAGEHSLQQLLPAAFGPMDLGITEPLFSRQQHSLAEIKDTPLLHAAWLAASQSYAPYSRSYAGVALQTHSGEIFCGRYAENAAFNPSLPPLQSALILLRMAGFAPDDVGAVSLVESRDGEISHQAATLALLDAYGISQFEYRGI
jgi:cytidine deaminase